MPLYEYLCQACASSFEELVSGSHPQPACPRCKSRKVERQLSRVAIGKGGDSSADAVPMGCGSCGDPRGPGACGMN